MSSTPELLRSLPIVASLSPEELGKIAVFDESERSTNESLKSFLALSMF